MRLGSRSHGRAARWALALTVKALFVAVTPAPAEAQLYVAPEAGWSEARGPTMGGRVGWELGWGLGVVLQGLRHEPNDDTVGDPDVLVGRSAWEVGINVLYTFDGDRALSPYIGLGTHYGRRGLTVIVDSLRSRRAASGWEPNLIGGIQLSRLPGLPFLEVRGGDGRWTATGGARIPVG